jgi:predicted metal-dependent HD superfamily phosphohydrolase
VNEISDYINGLFNKYQKPYLLYHNLEHTQYVVKKSEEIAQHYLLGQEDFFILATAAWFHDTGQLFSYGKGHEEKSVAIMKEYFSKRNIQTEIINNIETCIMATKIPHRPISFLQEIICDADTYNLGTKHFFKTDNWLRQECELKESTKIYDWNKSTLKFLEHHQYFTSYCQNQLNKGKEKNIQIIRSKIKG